MYINIFFWLDTFNHLNCEIFVFWMNGICTPSHNQFHHTHSLCQYLKSVFVESWMINIHTLVVRFERIYMFVNIWLILTSYVNIYSLIQFSHGYVPHCISQYCFTLSKYLDHGDDAHIEISRVPRFSRVKSIMKSAFSFNLVLALLVSTGYVNRITHC